MRMWASRSRTRCRPCSLSGGSGGQRALGRAPTDDDLIVAFAEPGDHFGDHLDDQMMLRRFHADLKTLGFRPRRQHDTPAAPSSRSASQLRR